MSLSADLKERRDTGRPSVLSEVRAWMLVAIAIIVHTVGVTWWGATVSANLQSLKDAVLLYQAQYSLIENRVRLLENRAATQAEQLRILQLKDEKAR